MCNLSVEDMKEIKEIKETVDALKNAIHRIGKEVSENRENFNIHTQVEAINIKNMENGISSLSQSMTDMLGEFRAQRALFDSSIKAQRDHIEAKISQCYRDMSTDLKSNYYTKPEVLLVKDEAMAQGIKDRKNDIEAHNEKLHKSAKSHLTIIWLAAVIFYGMATWIFSDFRDDFKAHVKDYNSGVKK